MEVVSNQRYATCTQMIYFVKCSSLNCFPAVIVLDMRFADTNMCIMPPSPVSVFDLPSIFQNLVFLKHFTQVFHPFVCELL